MSDYRPPRDYVWCNLCVRTLHRIMPMIYGDLEECNLAFDRSVRVVLAASARSWPSSSRIGRRRSRG
ncbi:hypothetical protein NEUTE1DRAFT_140358 [Neurospora tetrasperma FGSC 2508]|uniref:Uncharacterized protein n=1 Tax=Neurospora tetrasperma (strain FGSC 2508 / ATCC MYA-4615 / P0657) TaxID=510951 RepID=F8MVW1_NEUT8|nr:uncharacterized protein NEUTE1DRAFT_140358 [Neurospora tetrasperma FGSC 2508]EGO54009.1 hypothetical protein NEUTE1DRAFT_140358 [Neurospora tetrasperma FGSC 2508]